MADRALPSREAFPPRLGPVLYHMAEQKLIVDAYHSGRLVDREAINHEAAKEQTRIWLETVDIDDEPLIHSRTIDAIGAAFEEVLNG